MNDGKIGTMKVLDSFQHERSTIYLFVNFFYTVMQCFNMRLHCLLPSFTGLLSYGFMRHLNVNNTEEISQLSL